MGSVLLVDADRSLTRQTRRYIERRRHSCRVASSLASARRMFTAAPPDLVIVASQLPDGHGLTFLADLLREDPEYTVLVTFDDRDAAKSSVALEMGAFDAFIKAGETPVRLAGRAAAILDDFLADDLGTSPTQMLAEANALLRAQLDITSEAVLVADMGGSVASFNQRFLELWDLPPDRAEAGDARELLRGMFDGAVPLSEAHADPALLVGDPDPVLEDQLVLIGDGRVFAWSTNPVRLEDGSVIGRAFGFRDHTAQIAAEEQVRFQSTLLEQVPSAVIATEMDGTVRYWNRFAERLHGWTADETLGEDVRPFLFAGSEGIEALSRVGDSPGQWHGEVALRKKDGTSFPALLTLTRLDDVGSRSPMLLGVIIDLSERRSLEARLLQAQKMEAVGTLAGGLAHDFNNLLTGVLGSSALARELPETSPDMSDLMDIIERAALRGRDLCSQLLSFSRVERPQVEPVNTLDTISEVVKIVERTFPKEVRVSVETSDDLPLILADPSRINQALMNLLVNARDAMPDGGNLIVRATKANGVPADELHSAEGREETYVRLEVEDEGVGMVPEVLRRVFEPFFTTKGSGKGTGLGMPIVFSIARSHGGAVRVWSRVGRGTSVAMFVPIAPAHTQSRPPERLSDEDLERFAGTETILVVDDEAIVRSVGTKILKQFGYRTVEAASGSEALRIVADERENVAAILLDIVMPEMEGPEVFKRLKERGIDVPVLLCSGFSVAGLVDGMRAQGVAGFVQKPYRLPELLPALRAALDDRPVAARG